MVAALLPAVLATFLATFAPACAGETKRRILAERQFCLVEVLRSEELPIGPLFWHTVRATLLVTAPDRPAFQTTVQRVIPWQAPPPRQGQRLSVPCDPALIESLSFRLNDFLEIDDHPRPPPKSAASRG
jgi:hypothetical protein